jgi:uncharacterized protein (TIGR00251 family)
LTGGPLTLGSRGLSLALRVQPNAGSDRILGLVTDAAGTTALKVKVSAPAEDGRANAAVLALLAKALGLPKSALSLVKGERDRNKVVALAGDPAVLQPRLAAWLAARPARKSG